MQKHPLTEFWMHTALCLLCLWLMQQKRNHENNRFNILNNIKLMFEKHLLIRKKTIKPWNTYTIFYFYWETCSCLIIKNQAEAKKLEDSSVYLSLPSTKLELEEKGYANTGKNSQNLGTCTISKDSFQIATLVCSTKLTQNGKALKMSQCSIIVGNRVKTSSL